MPVDYQFKRLLWENVAAWSTEDDTEVTNPPGENNGSGTAQS